MTGESGMGKGLMYCPHPFTNWSLNPTYYSQGGSMEHTIEGFRRTDDHISVAESVKKNPDAYKVVCIGGSATYCNYIEKYEDSWPSLLKKNISKKETLVYNFGVAGWGTIQSSIRALAWLPVICPDLVIFHQARNDLTFLFHGPDKEKTVLPDYGNIIGQLSDVYTLRFGKGLLCIPLFRLIEMRRLKRMSFAMLYKPKPLSNVRGFDRFNDDMLNGILFRVESIIRMCRVLGCRFLYVTEAVRSTDDVTRAYADILGRIYERVPRLIYKYENAAFLDLRNSIPEINKYFLDSMHYTKEGCERFTALVAEKIKGMEEGGSC
jgi:hypothetical protein